MVRKRNSVKRKHFSSSGSVLIFFTWMDFLRWEQLENWFLIDFMVFFPSSANGLSVKSRFYPLLSSCFSVLFFETLFIFLKEGPNSSLSLSLPTDSNLKPPPLPFPILHLQGFVQSTILIKNHWWARLSMIYNVLGSAEVVAKIAFMIFWPMIVT